MTKLARYIKKEEISIAEFSRRCGISYQTVFNAVKGKILIRRYGIAEAISKATSGYVTIKDLCG